MSKRCSNCGSSMWSENTDGDLTCVTCGRPMVSEAKRVEGAAPDEKPNARKLTAKRKAPDVAIAAMGLPQPAEEPAAPAPDPVVTAAVPAGEPENVPASPAKRMTKVWLGREQEILDYLAIHGFTKTMRHYGMNGSSLTAIRRRIEGKPAVKEAPKIPEPEPDLPAEEPVDESKPFMPVIWPKVNPGIAKIVITLTDGEEVEIIYRPGGKVNE